MFETDEGERKKMNKRDGSDLSQRYADHLEFLWEQYNKLMGIGLIASAATLGLLLQGILFNKDVREVITSLGRPLNTNWLISAIITAGIAAILFIVARWCSQILMERQIYGKHSDAEKYFKEILENETIWPTALKTKPYMFGITRKGLLKFVGILNEVAKWFGILLIAFSWFSSFVFAWPLIEPLTAIKPKINVQQNALK